MNARTWFSIRPAHTYDCDLFYQLRNDPEYRKYFRNAGHIPYPEHTHWYYMKLGSKDARYLTVVSHTGAGVGYIRFDRMGGREWSISVAIVPQLRWRGIMSRMVPAAFGYLGDWGVGVTAQVHPDNAAALRLFRGLGFTEIGMQDKYMVFRKAILQ